MTEILVIINYPLQEQIKKGNINILKINFNNLLNMFDKVHVVSLKDNSNEKYDFGKNIIVHKSPFKKYSNRNLTHILNLKHEVDFVKKILKDNPNIVVIRALATLSSGLIAVKATKNIPVIISLHVSQKLVEEKEGRKYNKIMDMLEKFVMKRATLVPCISEYIKEEAIRLGVTEDKIVMHPNFVNTDLFKPSEQKYDKPTIVTVGRLTKWKYTDIVIKSILIIKGKYPDIQLKIIGSGVEEDNLKQLVKDLHLESNVEFMGDLDHETELPMVMGKSHILAVGIGGFSILEGASCSIPVIVSNFEWAKEIIDKECLINETKPEGYAKIIINLLGNTKLMKIVGENNRKKVIEHFSINSYEKREISFYNKIINYKYTKR